VAAALARPARDHTGRRGGGGGARRGGSGRGGRRRFRRRRTPRRRRSVVIADNGVPAADARRDRDTVGDAGSDRAAPGGRTRPDDVAGVAGAGRGVAGGGPLGRCLGAQKWLDGLRATTTDEYLGVLAGVDPSNIEAARVTGPPTAVRVSPRSVQVDVPTDTFKLVVTVVMTVAGDWRVSGNDRA